MSIKTPTANEGIDAETETDLDARDARALTEYISVLPEGGDIYTVVGQHGGTYTVDAREGRCTCPDAEYNLDDDERCKHQRRDAFATGAVVAVVIVVVVVVVAVTWVVAWGCRGGRWVRDGVAGVGEVGAVGELERRWVLDADVPVQHAAVGVVGRAGGTTPSAAPTRDGYE